MEDTEREGELSVLSLEIMFYPKLFHENFMQGKPFAAAILALPLPEYFTTN